MPFHSATSIDAQTPLPETARLDAVYPKSFNSSVAIQFSSPPETPVALQVFNVLGQKVRDLSTRDLRVPEPSCGTDETATAANVGSGVYVVRLGAGAVTESRKITLLR